MNAARKARKAARRANAASLPPNPPQSKKPAAQSRPSAIDSLSQQAILDLFTAPDAAPKAASARILPGPSKLAPTSRALPITTPRVAGQACDFLPTLPQSRPQAINPKAQSGIVETRRELAQIYILTLRSQLFAMCDLLDPEPSWGR